MDLNWLSCLSSNKLYKYQRKINSAAWSCIFVQGDSSKSACQHEHVNNVQYQIHHFGLDGFFTQAQLIHMVVWMLQRRLLIQLHTYVCLLVPPSEDEPGPREDDLPLAARVGGHSLSTPSVLSFGSPSTTSTTCSKCWLFWCKYVEHF